MTNPVGTALLALKPLVERLLMTVGGAQLRRRSLEGTGHPADEEGTNYHFCGNIMSAPSYVVTGANGCADKAACPAPITFDGQRG